MKFLSARTITLLLSRATALLLVCAPPAYMLYSLIHAFHRPHSLREGLSHVFEWSLLKYFGVCIIHPFFSIPYLFSLCVAYVLWRQPPAKWPLALTILVRILLVLLCPCLFLLGMALAISGASMPGQGGTS